MTIHKNRHFRTYYFQTRRSRTSFCWYYQIIWIMYWFPRFPKYGHCRPRRMDMILFASFSVRIRSKLFPLFLHQSYFVHNVLLRTIACRRLNSSSLRSNDPVLVYLTGSLFVDMFIYIRFHAPIVRTVSASSWIIDIIRSCKFLVRSSK